MNVTQRELRARAEAVRAMPSLAAYEALVDDLLAHQDGMRRALERLPDWEWVANTGIRVVNRAAVLAVVEGHVERIVQTAVPETVTVTCAYCDEPMVYQPGDPVLHVVCQGHLEVVAGLDSE